MAIIPPARRGVPYSRAIAKAVEAAALPEEELGAALPVADAPPPPPPVEVPVASEPLVEVVWDLTVLLPHATDLQAFC